VNFVTLGKRFPIEAFRLRVVTPAITWSDVIHVTRRGIVQGDSIE
jgi:hypothetical protein